MLPKSKALWLLMQEEEARTGVHLKYVCKSSLLGIYNEQITNSRPATITATNRGPVYKKTTPVIT